MKKWICLLAFVCTLGVAVLAAGIHSKAQAKPDDTILEGVYAGEISLSGMTRDQAKAAIQSYVDSLGSNTIVLNVMDGNTVPVTAWTELGESGAGRGCGQSGKIWERGSALQSAEGSGASEQGI